MDGREALRHLEATGADLILLDLNMPGMNGYEFIEQLRGTPALAGVPTIVLTSADLSAQDRLRLRSANAVLSKSHLSTTVLTDAIRDVLHATETVGAG